MAKQTKQEKAIMASLKSGQRVKFTPENIKRIPTKSGYYQYYYKGKLIYVGHADNNLRHRVESYDEKDDYDNVDGHPTKKALREILNKKKGVTFKIQLADKMIARKQEEIIKQHAKFNMDNKMNEAKKHETS